MEGGGLGGGAEGKFIHVGLAHRRRPGSEQASHAGRREDGLVALEHAARAGRASPHEVHVVLERNGDAGKGTRFLSPCEALVGRLGGIKRKPCRDLQEGVQLWLACVERGQRGLRHLERREVTSRDPRRDLPRRELVERHHQRSPSSSPKIEGTRK